MAVEIFKVGFSLTARSEKEGGGGPHGKNSDWLLSVPIRQKLREKSCSCRPIRVVEGEEVRDLNYF